MANLILIIAMLLPAREQHRIIFYLDQALMPNAQYLEQYVSDMNYILSKNTNITLTFNPADVIAVDSDPILGYFSGSLPEDEFDVMVYLRKSEFDYSYGGYMAYDDSGAIGIDGIKFNQVYDPTNLTVDQVSDYWRQITTLLHELGHGFGAAEGEYYSLATVNDRSEMDPITNISAYDPNDPFWADKQDFLFDPMLWNLGALYFSRDELLQATRYADLTAAIINGDYRNGTPPVAAAVTTNCEQVYYWDVDTRGADTFTLSTPLTSENGTITIPLLHNNIDMLKMVKACNKFGCNARYISVFDADIRRILYGDDLNISIECANHNSYIFIYIPLVRSDSSNGHN